VSPASNSAREPGYASSISSAASRARERLPIVPWRIPPTRQGGKDASTAALPRSRLPCRLERAVGEDVAAVAPGTPEALFELEQRFGGVPVPEPLGRSHEQGRQLRLECDCSEQWDGHGEDAPVGLERVAPGGDGNARPPPLDPLRGRFEPEVGETGGERLGQPVGAAPDAKRLPAAARDLCLLHEEEQREVLRLDAVHRAQAVLDEEARTIREPELSEERESRARIELPASRDRVNRVDASPERGETSVKPRDARPHVGRGKALVRPTALAAVDDPLPSSSRRIEREPERAEERSHGRVSGVDELGTQLGVLAAGERLA
jgi:hypothetical protein